MRCNIDSSVLEPDVVVFSPQYQFYDAKEFEMFVSKNRYILASTIKKIEQRPELDICYGGLA